MLETNLSPTIRTSLEGIRTSLEGIRCSMLCYLIPDKVCFLCGLAEEPQGAGYQCRFLTGSIINGTTQQFTKSSNNVLNEFREHGHFEDAYFTQQTVYTLAGIEKVGVVMKMACCLHKPPSPLPPHSKKGLE